MSTIGGMVKRNFILSKKSMNAIVTAGGQQIELGSGGSWSNIISKTKCGC